MVSLSRRLSASMARFTRRRSHQRSTGANNRSIRATAASTPRKTASHSGTVTDVATWPSLREGSSAGSRARRGGKHNGARAGGKISPGWVCVARHAPHRRGRALLWIPPIDALATRDALKQGQPDLGRTRPSAQNQLDVLEQSRLLGVARMVQGEVIRRERRNIDRVDAADDDGPEPGRHIAGSRHAAGKAAGNAERDVIGRGVKGDAVTDATDLCGQKLKAIAIDVGRGEDDLIDARHFGTVAIEIAQDLQQ